MVDEVALKVARAEERLAGRHPDECAPFAWLLIAAAGITALAALSWLLVPGPSPTAAPVAVRTLYGAATAAGLLWILGRLWVRARVHERARHIGMSPNLSPGLWALDARTYAGALIALFCVMPVAFAAGVHHRAGGTRVVFGNALIAIGAVGAPAALASAWSVLRRHRRRGGSRFVPSSGTLQCSPGQRLSGVLELRSWFEGTPAVLFELVHTAEEEVDGPFQRGRHTRNARVVASVTVPSTAFEHPPGLVVVPMALTVPSDAEPGGKAVQHATFPWQTYRSRRVRWALRASDPEGGSRYVAEFRVTVVEPDTVPAGPKPA